MTRRIAPVVAVLGLLVAGLLIGLLGEGERSPSPSDNLPDNAESTLATDLAAELPQDDEAAAVVLFTADEGTLDAAALEQLTTVAAGLDSSGGAETRTELVPSEDGTAALAVVTLPAETATQTAESVGDLREQAAADLPDGVTSQVTGPAAVEADLAAVFDGANTRLLAATAAIVALLLVITYRSPVLWLVPLTVVAVADRLAAVLATQVMAVLGVAWDESTIGILSVLVFGAGTNYALLLISRYRDELRATEDRYAAMRRAVRRTAEAVLASATTVVLGLLTLLLSLIPTTRGLGLACAIGVVVAATFVLVVLPAALVCFGRWIFWPRVPHPGEPQLVDTRSIWSRIGAAVSRRPGQVVVGTVLVLGVLSTGLLSIETGLSRDDQFLDEPEAISAGARLGESFPAGTSDPVQVVTRDDAEQVLAAVSATDGVSSARPSAQDGGISQIDAILTAEPGSPEAVAGIELLRANLAEFPETYVGGGEAQALDAGDAAQRDRVVIMPLILLLVLGALLVLLRSVVAALLLVTTVVATYAAALGLSWFVFTGVLGFAALDVGVPLLAFLFLVALGVDYNIFLVTRAKEESPEHGTRTGMLRALTATGGVITSAGILLAAVFAVLGVLPLVVLAQLGVVIFVGVLLDTLVVRTVLVPALALLLGDRFWWPRNLGGPSTGGPAEPAREPVASRG